MVSTETLHRLTDVSAEMLADAFKLRNALMNRLLRAAVSLPARKIARHALQVEAMIRQPQGQQEAARYMMQLWNVPVTATGLENVPTNGPMLVVANHAGWGDAMALWAKLPRHDVHTVVKTRGLLRAMPGLVGHMIVVAENQEMLALRRIIRCLQAGETVLLFPRGEIEPDPSLDVNGAIDSLDGWSPSTETIARRIPGLVVLPAAVGGVLSASAQNHPITRLYRKPQTREFVGATLQLMLNIFHDVKIDVCIGEPIPAEQARLPRIQQAMGTLLARYHCRQRPDTG